MKPSETTEQQLRGAKREIRETRKHIRALTLEVESYLACLDLEMTKHENPLRGQEIAKLSNRLEMASDIAIRFGLGKR
ncbi:MAG: hypothetical protein A3E01_15275 [Gammaproteobacteria bacterium RIFCSPHIGHO2_12_FULL_63_22]|nr:MAG: hypothetical protein A3E01_15275 [Gammaproteobacteria bacterium RIFCSPHIGHO2_12_FULL_63_22]